MSRPKIDKSKLCEILWHTVIIGRGTAAAAVADNLPDRDERDLAYTVAAIGKSDPWKGDRGRANYNDPSGFLNQTRSTTKHSSRPVPAHSSQTMKTVDWAAENELILAQATDLVYDAKVKHVNKVALPVKYVLGNQDKECFVVTLEDDRQVHAQRIIMAAGAGPDRLPEKQVVGISAVKQQLPNKVLSVTEFAKLGPKELNGVSVIVIGPNAAIDAVNKTLYYRSCKVHWLVSTKPTTLDTQPEVKKKEKEISIYYEGDLTITQNWGVITVSGMFRGANATGAYTKQTIQGRYVAYGLGPDPTPVADIIDPSIRNQLKPIPDVNKVFGKDSDAALGLHYLDSDRFLVVGALASQMVNSRDRKQLEELEEDIRKCQTEVLSLLPRVSDLALGKKPDTLARSDLVTVRAQLEGEKGDLETMTDDASAKVLLGKLADMIYNYCKAKQAAANVQNRFRIPATKLTSTIADSGQIGSIIAVMRALPTTNKVPTRIGTQTYTVQKGATKEENRADVVSSPGQADWSNDVEDDLQIYIALKYPMAPADRVNKIVEGIVGLRKQSATGFEEARVKQWEEELARLHSDGVQQYRDAHRKLTHMTS